MYIIYSLSKLRCFQIFHFKGFVKVVQDTHNQVALTMESVCVFYYHSTFVWTNLVGHPT